MSDLPYDQLLATNGVLVLKRVAGRTFMPSDVRPEWFHRFVATDWGADEPIAPADIFPFLEHFIEDAEQFWTGANEGELRSSIWSQCDAEGAELQFEAIASKVGEGHYLLIRQLTTSFEQLHRVFQKGRELSLAHERLVAETVKTEILLHCIIHDMSGPLQGMMGALQIAGRESLEPETKRFIDLGLLAAKRQENLIGDLLDTFRSGGASSETAVTDASVAPDIVACAQGVVATLQPAFESRKLRGEVLLPDGASHLRVQAETSRLERVFYNLLQNAMRYSPRGGTVSVSIREEPDSVYVGADDEGGGVPPEIVPQLFQKFGRRGSSSGKAGLGLFFCRITVEGWGGTIGCEPRDGKGTRFWFRLKKLP